MSDKKAFVRGLVILGIVSVLLLAGCGGGTAPASNSPQPPPQPTGVTVSPTSALVQVSGVMPFGAVVSPPGAAQAVTWRVSGAGCTGTNCGTVDNTGTYKAPPTVPNPSSVTLTATSSVDPTKSGSAIITIQPPPPPATPTAVFLIDTIPPAGATVLSFSLTVGGAVLEPGAVPLVTNPVSVEINRLQVETSLLANVSIPAGTYDSLTVTLANPVLTILNTSAAAIGSCASGAICKLNPNLTVSSVNLSGQPFPIAYDGTTPFALLVDVDLSKSLSSSNLESLNPAMTVQQLRLSTLDQGPLVKQVDGSILYKGGDDIVDGAFFDLVTDSWTLYKIDDSYAQYVDASLCGKFFCVQGKIAEVDLTLPKEARRVTLKSPDVPELEGVIVSVSNDAQFDMVLLHQVPPATGVAVGDVVRINLQTGATIEAVDRNLGTAGYLFSAPSDLLVGQVVTARALSNPSGTPIGVTVDRVRLKSGALTGRVKSILNATDFVLDNLPANFSSTQIQVNTAAQTTLQGISSVNNLQVGDTVSVSGFLFKTAGDPALLAEAVRKR